MRFVKSLAALAGALLVGFHGWVLAGQFAAGRLVDPWLILRWIIAAGLVAGFMALRRRGESLLGRKSVAIWVLAALLHGPTIVSKFGDAFEIPALPEVVVSVVARTATIGLLSLSLWILAGLIARLAHKPRLVARPAFVPRPNSAFDVGRSSRFSPRPPPNRS